MKLFITIFSPGVEKWFYRKHSIRSIVYIYVLCLTASIDYWQDTWHMTYRTLYSGVTFPRTLLRSAVSRKGGHGTRHLIYFEVICPMGIDFSKSVPGGGGGGGNLLRCIISGGHITAGTLYSVTGPMRNQCTMPARHGYVIDRGPLCT